MTVRSAVDEIARAVLYSIVGIVTFLCVLRAIERRAG